MSLQVNLFLFRKQAFRGLDEPPHPRPDTHTHTHTHTLTMD